VANRIDNLGSKIVTCGFGGPLRTGHVILRMRSDCYMWW